MLCWRRSIKAYILISLSLLNYRNPLHDYWYVAGFSVGIYFLCPCVLLLCYYIAMIRSLISLVTFTVVLIVFQLVAINLSGGVSGSLGIRPVTHKCIGFVIEGSTTSALPSGHWGFDTLLHFKYYIPEEREGKRLCLGQDVWMGE